MAVGLTPQMMPMILTANLVKGARLLRDKKCLVRNLSAVQNLGAMDILCCDKTGTLTEDNVSLPLSNLSCPHSKIFNVAALQTRLQNSVLSLMRVPSGYDCLSFSFCGVWRSLCINVYSGSFERFGTECSPSIADALVSMAQVTLLNHQDAEGRESEEVLKLAYLNCHFQVS